MQTEEVSDDDEKHLILCAVILGNVEKVIADSRQRYPSSAEFDTGADDLKNPKWYLVWPTNVSRHILPECVVSYKSLVCLPGMTRLVFRIELYKCHHYLLKFCFSLLSVSAIGRAYTYKVLISGIVCKA